MKIAVMPGDGIGKEVTAQAVKVLRAVLPSAEHLDLRTGVIGNDGLETVGKALPDETVELARWSDAILLGGVGVKEDEKRPAGSMAGEALLHLRKELDLFANFRPAFLYPELVGASTLRREIVEGLDLVILRELTGDLYFGQPRGIQRAEDGSRIGINTMRYTEKEITRVAHEGFKAARRRRKKLCSVDKANVLETMALWREVVTDVGREYPDVELSHLFVDAASMELLRNPRQFDVIVTGNVFGDILSDAAAMLTGSIGMLPSASFGEGKRGLYEPVHGTAPDIAGRDIANPLAAVLSCAMMLRYSFDQEQHATRIGAAVRKVLSDGYRTADIFEPGMRRVGTEQMGDLVAAAVG